jgi:hypothetical protein
MKTLDLQRFIALSNTLTEYAAIGKTQSGNLSPEDKKHMTGMLEKVSADCKATEMRCSLLQIDRMKRAIGASDVTHLELSVSLGELLRRLADEATTAHCLIMSQDEADLYATPQQFGAEVEVRFPSAVNDISEAARCLACGRGTAAVFHLMRVMEVGLKATAKALGIPYAPSWESYLSQIDTRVRDKYKAKGIKWRKDEPFFRDVAAHLHAVKVAWRNPTMHIVNHYSPEMAEDVFLSVKGFMRHLSTALTEAPGVKAAGR